MVDWNSEYLHCWRVSLLWLLSTSHWTYNKVKNIISTISQGRPCSHSPHKRGFRHNYCGQFSLSRLFYCHFQNWNNLYYLVTLTPKIIVTCLSLTVHVTRNLPSCRYMHIKITQFMCTSRLSTQKCSCFKIARYMWWPCCLFNFFFHLCSVYLFPQKDHIVITWNRTGYQ